MHPSGSEALIVVGEFKNTGPNVLDTVIVKGTFHTPDGEPYIVSWGTWQILSNILPQQKAPFYIVFRPEDIIGSPGWTTADATNFTAVVVHANITNARQYADLEITSHTDSVDADGYYRVTGVAQNTGSETTNRTWVVATFYNSTGAAIAIGYSDYLTSNTQKSIAPGGTATFTIYPLDAPAGVVAGIESYSLAVQTELEAAEPTPSPSPSPTNTPTTSPNGSPTPTPTGAGDGIASSDLYIYIAVAIVIVVVGVIAFVLRKRSGKDTAQSK